MSVCGNGWKTWRTSLSCEKLNALKAACPVGLSMTWRKSLASEFPFLPQALDGEMTAPSLIADLVERFDQQSDAYKSGQYNEAQLRQEFIDPMFKALGWDMENVSGYAEAYKDVIHEDAIKIGGATKTPDYCFRIGGTRKIFLPAKKPSVDIKTDAQPAYQLRRYAWSAKLPLSILTDFEEFAVYDCRIEPKLSDKASVARVLYLNFCEYVPEWEESPRSSRAKRFSKAPSISLPNRRRRSVARLRWMTHS